MPGVKSVLLVTGREVGIAVGRSAVPVGVGEATRAKTK